MAYTGRKTGTKPYDVYDKADVDIRLANKQDKATLKQDVEAKNIDAYTVQGVSKDLLGIGGNGYAWVDETANRALSTTYTNTYGKPIVITINSALPTATSNMSINIYVNGIDMGFNSIYVSASGNNTGLIQSCIVPANATYSVLMVRTSLSKWLELK